MVQNPTKVRKQYRKYAVRSAAIAVCSLAGVLANQAHAQVQIVLTPASVIGGTGSFASNPFNVGQFQAGNVFDNQLAAAIPEPNQNPGDADGGYWLGKEGDFNEFIVVDLGATTTISSFDIFNTHNANNDDRGTRDFQIFGANAIAPIASGETGAGGFDLSGPTDLLVSSTLAFQTSVNDPIEPQNFASLSSTGVRYLRFNAVNQYGNVGLGLNELKVFDASTPPVAAPEPTTLGLLGLGALPVGLAAIRRRRQK